MWTRTKTREIGPIGDALIYREYTLGLIWPRHCPEWIEDSDVSYWMNQCAKTERLPWKSEPGV